MTSAWREMYLQYMVWKQTDHATISNEYCKYFANVGSTQAAKVPDTAKEYMSTINTGDSLFLKPTYPNGIVKAIMLFYFKRDGLQVLVA